MKETINIILNNDLKEITLPPASTLLQYVRQSGLPGTKEGCGEGECGACTVLVGELKKDQVRYKAVPSCLLPIGDTHGKHIVTIEGLNQSTLNPIQRALVDEDASQCGYCTPGFVVSLTVFFLTHPNPGLNKALTALDGNICRCTGYTSIKRAITRLLSAYTDRLSLSQNRISSAVEIGLVPAYFLEIPGRLKKINDLNLDKVSFEEAAGRFIAGGTDLIVQQGNTLKNVPLRFLSDDESLKNIEEIDGKLRIGAGVTMEQIRNSEVIAGYFPQIAESLKWVSSTLVRNSATLGGNIVNASPIGDLSITFLALGALLTLKKGNQSREVALKDFFKAYKTLDLKPGELVECLVIDLPADNDRFSIERVSQRAYFDIASCNSALWIRENDHKILDVRLSAGGVSPIPLHAKKTSDFLSGETISVNTLKKAADILENEIAPISDVRGSATYKSTLMRHLFFGHFLKLFPDRITFEEAV